MNKVNLDDLKRLCKETSAGLVYCKKALLDAGGLYDKAKEILKELGHSMAAKKAGRDASEGVIAVLAKDGCGIMLELNCETDFVARNEKFQQFANDVLEVAHANRSSSPHDLMACKMQDSSCVADQLADRIAVFKENILLSRCVLLSAPKNGVVWGYVHSKYTENLGKVGVLVAMESSGDQQKLQEIAKKICIQVMSGSPQSISIDDLDKSVVEGEKTRYQDDIAGKPKEIAEKITAGKLQKFYREVVLLEQHFYMDNEKSVAQYLDEQAKEIDADIKVVSYKIFNLGATDNE